ncbi:hypothetical protein ABZ297_34085 [Nonomuraea sp. NPDC005983]|uniref:hypothetical protein n=1 Tax=Nonomuraea sp. NPDC005983 TaxID=3155595 RepID=UPI0033AA75C4
MDKVADLCEAGLPAQLCLTWRLSGDLWEAARAFGVDPRSGLRTNPEEIGEL